MGVADNLASITVEATSSDANLKLSVGYPGTFTLGFRPRSYASYDETGLAFQLAGLATVAMERFTRARRQAIGNSDESSHNLDARDRRYRAELATMVNNGRSAGNSVKVRCRGMTDWEFNIRPGTLKKSPEAEFVSEFGSAVHGLLFDHEMQVIQLKDKHFDLNLPSFLRQPPPA